MIDGGNLLPLLALPCHDLAKRARGDTSQAPGDRWEDYYASRLLDHFA